MTRVILRRSLATESPAGRESPAPAHDVEALLDNIRSAWNVGSIFRSADGFGISHLHLCGITPTPEHEPVAKTALGAERTVPWSYAADPLAAARRIKEHGRQLWALEHDDRAVPFDPMRLPSPAGPILLIVGNEITGVDPDLLDLCERIFHIPMHGNKRSLNVAVAFGIAAFAIQSKDGAGG
jgi:tRNA G18 (ribose-2'-O)-methylase SpoU